MGVDLAPLARLLIRKAVQMRVKQDGIIAELAQRAANGLARSDGQFVGAGQNPRRRGLLGRDGLDLSAALMLAPCPAVHTAFMRFAIDVVFVDREGRVRKIVRGLAPWRISASLGAYAAIEFTAGVERDLVPGDRLYLSSSNDAGGAGVLMSLARAISAAA